MREEEEEEESRTTLLQLEDVEVDEHWRKKAEQVELSSR